jgi:hypothetical protein
MQKYYTYAYLREDRTPYYIGKGKERNGRKDRMKARHFATTVPPLHRQLVLKIFDSEFDAYKHEIYMIAVFGRKDLGTGILHNKSGGGEGISNMSEYARKRTSETHKGKVLSEETKRKIGETRKRRGYTCSEEQKQKYSEMYTGEGNPNYGKKHSPETLKKISEGTLGKNTKTRHFITPTGERITITDLRKYCNENRLNHICMINLHNGYGKSYKGYKKASISNETVKM